MADSQAGPSENIVINVKHSSNVFQIEVSPSSTVLDVKRKLEDLTRVQIKRQKLLGLNIKGKPAVDETPLCEIPLKPDSKVTLMGTPEEGIFKDPSEVADLPEVLNDLDYDFSAGDYEDIRNSEENKKKLQNRIEKTKITLINPPRPGKKLLVLDIDYTIFDCKTAAETITILKRPFLEEFLTAVYVEYDLVFWSQTSWRWVEAKLTELGILTSPNYKVTFVLDRTSMFPITTRKGGETITHEVKALQVIWSHFPEFYSPQNTIHVDDLSRNFALNPANGLKITAYKNANVSWATDRELLVLTKFLTTVHVVQDVTQINFKKWKDLANSQ